MTQPNSQPIPPVHAEDRLDHINLRKGNNYDSEML